MGIETIIITSAAGLIGGTTSYIFEKVNRPDLAITADRFTKVVLIVGGIVAGYFLYSVSASFV